MPLLYRTTDNDKWGVGKGAPLTAAEVDLNFWQLDQRITAALEELGSPVSIESISVENGLMYITLTDETILGPYILPVAAFQERGNWANETEYFLNDLITDLTGLYRVLIPHTSAALPAVFNPNLLDGGNPVFSQVFGTPTPTAYHLGVNYLGLIPGGESLVFAHLPVANFTLPEDLAGSRFELLVATESDRQFKIYKYDGVAETETEIGAINFTAGVALGVIAFVSAVPFIANQDKLFIYGPNAEDLTAETLLGTIVTQAS